MKRLIRSNTYIEAIFGMAHDKKKAETKIEALSEQINNHIIKCVVYRNSTNDLQHWIYDELTTWFDYINNIDVKTKSGKLSERSFDSILFSEFGENPKDAEFNLVVFRASVAKLGTEYPDFQITRNLAKKLNDVYTEIRTTFLPIFTKKNNYTRVDIYNMLSKILK